MAKKSWFCLLKRFFISRAPSNRNKEKKWKWMFRKHKIRRLASILAQTEGTPVDEDQIRDVPESSVWRDHAEVLKIAESYETIHDNKECVQLPVAKFQFNTPESSCSREIDIRDVAATRIQTAYRGYLARKALKALKGVVRLQAIIRGRAVRRHAVVTLKRLQSIVNIQSQVCARRVQLVKGSSHLQEYKEWQDQSGKDIKIDINSQRRWDDSLLSKNEENAMSSSRRDAATKRERLKEYAFHNRLSVESEQNTANLRWRYWLEQWAGTQLAKREELQNSESTSEGRKFKLQSLKGSDSPMYFHRRSLQHRRQRSIGEDYSDVSSPFVPTYMAATESAKAKTRSLSSPRSRPRSLDSNSDVASPYKNKLSPLSSFNSDATSSSRVGSYVNGGGFAQRSPSLKGVLAHVKSGRTYKNSGSTSESSRKNFDRNASFM